MLEISEDHAVHATLRYQLQVITAWIMLTVRNSVMTNVTYMVLYLLPKYHRGKLYQSGSGIAFRFVRSNFRFPGSSVFLVAYRFRTGVCGVNLSLKLQLIWYIESST